MAPANAVHWPKADPKKAGGVLDERNRLNLLHYSHIFASVVRDILEAKFLDEVTPHSLTLSQFHLLKLIALNGNHQVGEVAVFLGMSPPAATKNLDKLKRLGLILRSPSKGDRRATLVSPSAKGRRLVQEYENLKAGRLSPVLELFTSKEMEQLVRLLKRFSLSIIKQENAGGGLCLWCAAYCQPNCAVAGMHGGCPHGQLRRSV
jgi:DNA-binding MarR family transcriptional regulator